MKKHLLLIVFSAWSFILLGQVSYPIPHDSLDINQVNARINSNAYLWWNSYNDKGAFNIPRDSATVPIFEGGIWIGGMDSLNHLHLAEHTYGQDAGGNIGVSDYFPGPIMDSVDYSTVQDSIWNRVWKINRSTIDSFVNWYADNSLYPGYTIPQSILDWPGNGDTTLGEDAQLAPFVDVNNDGIYDPVNAGDYPCIKGDQDIFFLINDDRGAHTEGNGQKLGIEIKALAYEYHYPGSPLDTTVFLHLDIINRSTNNYHNVYLGNWTDFDDGYYADDAIQCDVDRAAYYVYNGYSIDGTATYWPDVYGHNPPAEAVVFLQGPSAAPGDGIDNNHNGQIDEPRETCTMNHFMFYYNDFTIQGNPITAINYYNYMRSFWIDSTHVTYSDTGYGGSVPCDYMYPGNSDPSGWGTNMTPQPAWYNDSIGDIRGVASSGPFPLASGQTVSADFAYVFGRAASGGNLASVTVMQHDIDSVRSFYLHHVSDSCQTVTAGIKEQQQIDYPISVYPNPAKNNIMLSCRPVSKDAQYFIINELGQNVKEGKISYSAETLIHVGNLAHGLYLLRVKDGDRTKTVKFVH